MKQTNNGRMAALAVSIFVLDQLTKLAVLKWLPTEYVSEKAVLPGFFRLVHWRNTGAAWSMFHDNNLTLAIISAIALVVLIMARRRFHSHLTLGWISLGLIFGGIAGNLLDRIVHKHVIDFLYFHLNTRSGNELGFPAFNVADSAICIGVGLLFILSWRNETGKTAANESAA